MKTFFLLIAALCLIQVGYSQVIKGFINGINPDDAKLGKEKLIGANVYWENTTIGTITNSDGYFEIERHSNTNNLVVSYIGYKSDTIYVDNEQKSLNIILESGRLIDEVSVKHNVGGQVISSINPIFTQVITENGLKKLPCCNLSESFENNAGVDINISDAVTGAKQIQMLGLAGIYSQILVENIPTIRGLGIPYGLSHIPGPWMESIQISKGTSAVVNGYESITGQINLQLKEPQKSERLYVNLFGNSEGRGESNIYSAWKLSDKVSSILLFHGSLQKFILDHNKDGFADIPLNEQINVTNRWSVDFDNGVEIKSGFRIMNENREGGQVKSLEKNESGNFYKTSISTNRYEAYAKLGIPFHHGSGLGNILSVTHHDQQSLFGLRKYDASHNSIYFNSIYETEIFTEEQKINAGISFQYDYLSEKLMDTVMNLEEIVPGAFAQYTFLHHDEISIVAGIRADHHNIHGLFLTPRLHARFKPFKNFTIRGSAGKGYRVANPMAENIGFLASSRDIIFSEKLKAEEAWNYGVNIHQVVKINHKKSLSLSLEFYRTDFLNQVIADMDASTREVRFYNLDGKSYSNSFQAELTAEFFPSWEITTAFRFNDVKTTMHDDLINKPLVSRYKGLLTISYKTISEKWKFDLTNQLNGWTYLPSTASNPDDYRLSNKSPNYLIIHAQLTREFKRFSIYGGVENLTNYIQEDPIIAFDEPFGTYFDSSIIWGPLSGRMFYLGLRFYVR